MRTSRRSGFALLASLGLSMAIVAVTLAFSLDAHRDRQAMINQVEHVQALAAARAGVAVAQSRLDRLLTGGYPPPPVPVDNSDPWQFADTLISESAYLNGPGSARYVLRVRDANAMLSIENTNPIAWTNFLTALNVDGDVATHLAATISDWVDADDITQLNGAERAEYIAAGRLVLPSNAGFGAIDDLRNVMGMTPSIFRAIKPYLVISLSEQIGVNTAPTPVLRTIPQFTDPVIAAIMARRQTYRRIASPADLAAIAPSIASQLTEGSPLVNQLSFVTGYIVVSSTGYSAGGHTRVTETDFVQRGATLSKGYARNDQ